MRCSAGMRLSDAVRSVPKYRCSSANYNIKLIMSWLEGRILRRYATNIVNTHAKQMR